MSIPTLTTENLCVCIGTTEILKNVNIAIESGKVTAILGPNGAGKSTLLRCLTRAQKASSGTITFDGAPLDSYRLDDLAKKRAVLSQATPITFPFSVAEIVMMGRNPYHTGHKDADIIDQTLNAVDALSLKHRLFPTLSGGEQQRVQIARVLAQLWSQDDACLILDEPTSALDLKHQHKILTLVADLAKSKNFSVCTSLHDLTLARRYSDQVILLKNGQLFTAGDTTITLNSTTIAAVFDIPTDLALSYT